MKKNAESMPTFSFKTQKTFREWLEENYNSSSGVWLRLYKKDSGIGSITHDEALGEALCFGWIDGQANRFDDKSWIQKFTPRRPKSIWSKKNAERAEKLIRLGKMKPAGLREIDVAKADGRWEKAYDSPANMKIPEDFMKRLSKDKKAFKFFKALNRTNLYSIAWRLQTAKKPETREKRITQIIEMLSKGEKFH
jgi:uncharacterized protein YdeI (YjbR/CyaY-like superfamily)